MKSGEKCGVALAPCSRPLSRLDCFPSGHISQPHYINESAQMAKSRDGSKSQAIQNYLAANKEAMPKQIVEALKERGVEVSLGLANKVKYGKPGRNKASAKKAKRIAAVRGEPALTGSESIRRYIAKNPAAGPKGIEAGLKAEGIRVSKALISAVKYSKAKRLGRKAKRVARRATVHAAARATPSSAVTIDQLIELKQFADSFGGADQVRQALDTLEQLQ